MKQITTFLGDFAEMPSKAQQRRKKDKERRAAITGQGGLFELIDKLIFNRLPHTISYHRLTRAPLGGGGGLGGDLPTLYSTM